MPGSAVTRVPPGLHPLTALVARRVVGAPRRSSPANRGSCWIWRGSGRFWPVLAEHVNRVILASDNSQAMLDHALTHHPASLLKRVKTFQGSAFSIGLSANAVDCNFCARLLVMAAQQRRAPGVAARVSPRQPRHGDRIGLASRPPCGSGFRQAGFKVLSYQEFMPGSSQWRVYVLCKRG